MITASYPILTVRCQTHPLHYWYVICSVFNWIHSKTANAWAFMRPSYFLLHNLCLSAQWCCFFRFSVPSSALQLEEGDHYIVLIQWRWLLAYWFVMMMMIAWCWWVDLFHSLVHHIYCYVSRCQCSVRWWPQIFGLLEDSNQGSQSELPKPKIERENKYQFLWIKSVFLSYVLLCCSY